MPILTHPLGVGNYFPEKQEVTYPTPAPPLHGRGGGGAQGFSFLAHPALNIWICNPIIWLYKCR
jgi:hypothetical protein